MNIRSAALIAVLAAIYLLAVPPARADIPTMTVSEIEAGMRGVGYTVAKGTEIEQFQCEIIGVFDHMGYNGGPLILLRMWGDVIDATGGIAGGYSGSPVFIDGKLIGALSWGPWFTEGDVAGATPINDMLRTFRYPVNEEPERIAQVPECLDEPITVGGRDFNGVLLAQNSDHPADLERIWGENTLVLTPCRTPVVVSGLSPEGFERLKEFAQDRLPYMEFIQGPGGGPDYGVPILLGPTVLEPGASIGAQLASGDLDLTAVGTLTWIDDQGRFLAFGHPFLADGPTNLPFVTTEIIYTMPALDRSYKLGQAIEVVGTITQDRLTAVGGQLRQIPDMVDFHLEVVDHDTGRTRRYNYSVMNKEEWLPFLGLLMPADGLTFVTDRLGTGTCLVSFTIYGEGLAKPIQRENLSYAGFGVAYEALGELTEALNMVTAANPYREVKVTKVDIHVEVTSARQTTDILKARYQNPPNMGPGAVGYTGPEEEEADKEAKDRALNQAAPWLDGESSGAQQPVPPEGMMIEGAEAMAAYYAGYPQTKLVGYYPGDTIEVLVTLRPYRQEPIERVIKLEIPGDFPACQTTLEVFGGAAFYYPGMYYYMGGPGGTYPGAGVFLQPEDLDEVLDDFMSRDVGNCVIVRLARPGPEDPYFYLQDEFEPPEEVRASIALEDVVYGQISLPIEILGEAGEMPQQFPMGEMPEGMQMPGPGGPPFLGAGDTGKR